MTATWYNQIEAFKREEYVDIDLDRLTAYAVRFLYDRRIEATFENIVVALYKMFPEEFALVGFHEYPDSNRVNRQLLHCRPKYKSYLVGGVRQGWVLTEKGVVAAEEAKKILENPSLGNARGKKRSRKHKERSKPIHFVQEILRSKAYEKYLAGKHDQIGDIELFDLLHANPDTPTSIVETNIQKLRNYAQIVENRDVSRFLEFVRKRLVVVT